MNGILYFSSTGNSLYIAKKIRDAFGGNIFYIPNYSGCGEEFERIFIVTPIYSFGMPTPVFELFQKLNKNTEIIVIQNYGGMAGGADWFLYDYAKNRLGLNVIGVYKIKMTENYTLFLTVPKYYQNYQLKQSEKRVQKVISDIASDNLRIPKKCKTKEKTYFKNKSNWHLIAKDFSANEDCVKCGKCVKICPVQNIFFENGKVCFGDKCIACLGCYHRCPQKAIIYKNKKKKYRYVNPFIDEKEIGKDL